MFGFRLAGYTAHPSSESSKFVVGLIEMGCYDIDGGDFSGCTPLGWASHNGHEEVVKILLGWKEVYPDKPDNSGKTPLSHATLTGHEGVVKILLEREEANPDKPSNSGLIPLSLATRNGHERVVALLHSRKASIPSTI